MEIVSKTEKIAQKGLLSQTILIPKKIADMMDKGQDVSNIKVADLWDYKQAKDYIKKNAKKLFQPGFSYKILSVFPRGVRMKKDSMFKAGEDPQFYADEIDYADPISDDDVIGLVIYKFGKNATA